MYLKTTHFVKTTNSLCSECRILYYIPLLYSASATHQIQTHELKTLRVSVVSQEVRRSGLAPRPLDSESSVSEWLQTRDWWEGEAKRGTSVRVRSPSLDFVLAFPILHSSCLLSFSYTCIKIKHTTEAILLRDDWTLNRAKCSNDCKRETDERAKHPEGTVRSCGLEYQVSVVCRFYHIATSWFNTQLSIVLLLFTRISTKTIIILSWKLYFVFFSRI